MKWDLSGDIVGNDIEWDLQATLRYLGVFENGVYPAILTFWTVKCMIKQGIVTTMLNEAIPESQLTHFTYHTSANPQFTWEELSQLAFLFM